jgi:CHAT domain-containing protein
VREARTHISRIESAAIGARLRSGLDAVEGALRVDGDPEGAIRLLSQALAFLRDGGYEYGQAEILLDRARARRHLGDVTEALGDIEQAAALVTAQRGRIVSAEARVSFFDLQTRLVDERVAASVGLDPGSERAFWAADQARGLTFRDTLGVSALRPATAETLERLAGRIGKSDAVVAYWTLPDTLLIWIVRRGAPLQLVQQPVDRQVLATQITDLVGAIEAAAGPPVISSLARAVGQQLLGSVHGHLRGVRRLIVVPDRVVRDVPWAALEHEGIDGPLVRHVAVRISPAAEILPTLRKGNQPLDDIAAARLLAVGDPFVARSMSTAYPALPGAQAEVEEVASLFSDSVKLTGLEATRRRLLAELGRASVVHIATHFVTGREPGSARMLLTASGSGDDYLDATAIARLPLDDLRLVVLSGCATDRESVPSLEGTYAAAGSFLVAGAREAVATLWRVDDRFTPLLMRRLYSQLLDGQETDEALRRAQLALLDGADMEARLPAHWAAFRVISLYPQGGAYTEKEERDDQGADLGVGFGSIGS